MDDLLEYMRRLYEEQFSDFRKWECPQFFDGKICICIHSIAMSYFLYVADCCYYLDKGIRYQAIWNPEYNTYFLKGICEDQIFVELLRQQDKKCECYLENELCKNEELPFHYVIVRLTEKEDIATKYLLGKMEKGNNSWNLLIFFCKVARTFRKRTDKEYADLLLRTTLFLFPHSMWKLLEKSQPTFVEREEKAAYARYNLNLLDEYMEISRASSSPDRMQIMNTLEKFLKVPIWKIWRHYENEYKTDLLEPILQDQICRSRAQSKRFAKFIDQLESLLEEQEKDDTFKKMVTQCKKIVNDLRN